ncbi:unnamed protein product, partial [Pelagomonas calceolata]
VLLLSARGSGGLSGEAAQLLHEEPERDVADDGEGRVGRRIHAALVVVADEGAQPEVDDLAADGERRGQRRGDALRIEVEQHRRQERRVLGLVELGTPHALVELGLENFGTLRLGRGLHRQLEAEHGRHHQLCGNRRESSP